MSGTRLTSLLATTGVLCSSMLFLLRAGPPPAIVGKAVRSFTLKDTRGGKFALADFKEKKAVVLLFVGTQCPINNLYLDRVSKLHQQFTGQGVQFLAINSNSHDSAHEIAEHARKHHIPFPVLRDEKNRMADLCGAVRTPEAFVLDAGRVIRYHGRIDDQYGIDYRKPKASRQDLVEAIQEVLAGKSVSQPETAVSGCFIARAVKTRRDGTVTFTRDIAPILQKNCQECHRPGQVGPMPLLTYADATAWAETIREVLNDRRMPPWYADPRYGKFSNDRSLPVRDRELLLAWLDQGLPRGDDADLPPPRAFFKDWKIGKPDMIFTMPAAFSVPADMPRRGVPYQYFIVPTNFEEDRWVERAQAKPGATGVVHHIIVFVLPPGETFVPGNPRTPTLCGTAPGEMPLILPPGMAKKVPKGSRLVFQMHYTPNGKTQKDRSSVGLIFAKKPPRREVVTVPVANIFFRIPPGAGKHEVKAVHRFRREGHIIGFMPHMHLRGKDFVYRARYPDGKSDVLLSVPRFNFNWQSVYRPAQPLRMPKDTVIECVAHFDNSAKNLNNPDPSRTVTWGDQTWEEMMVGWVDIAYDRPAQGK